MNVDVRSFLAAHADELGVVVVYRCFTDDDGVPGTGRARYRFTAHRATLGRGKTIRAPLKRYYEPAELVRLVVTGEFSTTEAAARTQHLLKLSRRIDELQRRLVEARSTLETARQHFEHQEEP